jgi:hypothetical protein
MASNIVATASQWHDGISTPPSVWNGTAYTMTSESDNIFLTGYTTQPGDFISFAATCSAGTGGVDQGTIEVSVNGSPLENQAGQTVFEVTGTSTQWSLWEIPSGSTSVTVNFNAGASASTTLTARPAVRPVPTAPNLSVSVGNMQSADITPQIVENSLPIQGYQLAVVTPPSNGTVTVDSSGLFFVYTPTLGMTMVSDSFTYTATDSGGSVSNVGMVSIFIFTQYNCACDGDEGEYPSVSLDTLQRRLLVRMSMAAMPIPPPGMAEFANDFLKQAQHELYHKYRVFRSPRWFTWRLQQNQRFYDWTENVEVTSMLVQPPTLLSVTAATTGGNVPAGQTTYAITFVTDNGETTPSNQITVTNTGSTSANTLTWALSTQQIKATNIYRVAANGPYGESQLYYVATVNNAVTYVDTAASVTSTQPAPNINSTSLCPKKMNPRRILWVGISRGDNVWQPLFEGIDPTEYSPKIQAIPRRYEIHQCIELWPAPSDNTWQMRIKADMNLLPFEAPTDTTSIDPAAIFLHALMFMKAHYGKPDAQAVSASLTEYIRNLVADTRSTHRAWPGKGVIMNAIPPKMAPQ